jgi:hypothetical protein
VKGEQNTVADALSWLETTSEELVEVKIDDKLPDTAYPLNFKLIMKHQQNDNKLLKRLQENVHYQLKTFSGGGKVRRLIARDNKIVVPDSLLRRVVDRYHTYLCHPGETRTELTVRQHFTGTNLREIVHEVCKNVQLVKRRKDQQKNTENFPKRRPKTSHGKNCASTLSVRIALQIRKVAPF